MTKIKALIIFLSLLVIGLSVSLTVVVVNKNKPSSDTPSVNPPSSDVTPTTSNTPTTGTTTKEVSYFTIQFIDYDDTVLDEVSVKEGEIPSYTKELPTRSSENNSIYRFVGWTPELVKANANAVYRANYAKDDYFVVSFDSNGGTSNSNNQIIEKDKCATNPGTPTREHYSFDGWYYNDALWDFETTITTDITLVAKWTLNKNNLIITNSDSEKGAISGNASSEYEYNSEITLVAAPATGYIFDGWYSGDNLISSEPTYTFNMPDSSLSLEARWTARTDIQYTVKHYKQNIDNDEYTIADTDNLTGTTATLTEATLKDYEGFTAPTLEQVYINGDGSTLIELYYTRNSHSLTLQNSESTKGSITDLSGTYKYGKTINLTATPEAGYVFIGWFSSNNLLSILENYEFSMPDNDVMITVKWIVCSDISYTVKHYKQNIDNDEYTIADTDNLTGTTATLTEATLKDYEGFTAPTLEQVYINGDGSTLIELYYTRNSHSLTLQNSDSTKGSITDLSDTYKYGQSITLVATPNSGYVFGGWFDGTSCLSTDESYTFTMPDKNLTVKAIFGKMYSLTTNVNDDSAGSITAINHELHVSGSEIQLVMETNVGYTFVGLFKGDVQLTTSLNYTFTMPEEDTILEARWIKVTLTRNNPEAGAISSLNSTYIVGRNVTIRVFCTNPGYTFDGWYKNDTLVTSNTSYTLKMPSADVIYEARWTAVQSTLTIVNEITDVTVTGAGTYVCGEKVNLVATGVPSGKTIIWKNGDNVLSYGNEYLFTMPETDVTITVELAEIEDQYVKVNDTIFFGSYPQTRVADNNIISQLNTSAGELPSVGNNNSWTDYGYYINGNVESYMWYIDIDQDNDGTNDYRGVYFIDYRQRNINSEDGYINQYTNGYLINTVYWFKYEPIRWNILSVNDGNVLIIADLLLDSQNFTNSTSTDYNNSTLKSWLNDNFYNTAFNVLEKKLLIANNNNFVSLLSRSEASQYFASTNDRTAIGTDYARSQALYVTVNENNSSSILPYLGNSYWRLKDASVSNTGEFNSNSYNYIDQGIRPVCRILLAGQQDYYFITYNLDGGNNNTNNPLYYIFGADNIALSSPSKTGYSFIGWEYNGNIITEIDTSLACDIELTALWQINSYKLTVNNNNPSYGELSGDTTGMYEYNSEITLIANTTDSEAFFAGWYDGKSCLSTDESYTFTMPNKNLTIKAVFGKMYSLTTIVNDESAGSVTKYINELHISGSTIDITMTTKAGYTFVGLFNGDVRVTSNLKYAFTMPEANTVLEARWIKVTLINTNHLAGVISKLDNTYQSGNNVQLKAYPNLGYTFEGWYKEDELVSSDTPFSLKMPSVDETYEARWKAIQSTLAIVNEITDVTVSGAGTYDYGEKVNLVATGLPSNKIIVWKNGDNILSYGNEYLFTMPETDITITAELIDIPNKFVLVGNVIFFGSYPQTRVDDNNIISQLNTLAGDLPSVGNNNSWTDYGYYINGNVESYMWYIDIDQNNDGTNDYRGVYFIDYRQRNINSEDGYINQYSNGYYINNTYWFKYEPIRWNIINVNDGNTLIIADLLLDSQNFTNSTSSNYNNSTIKSWLNNNFYNTAFNALEKSHLVNIGDDAVSLLSRNEASQYFASDSERIAIGTDYAKSQGLYVTVNETGKANILPYLGNSYWRLKDANVSNKGELSYVYYYEVIYSDQGIRPVCLISFDNTIIYELDGGTNNSNNPNKYIAGTDNIVLYDPSKTGYRFIGWEYNGDIITEIDTSLNCDIELIARWKINQYTIIIENDVDGLNISGSVSGNQYDYNTPLTLNASGDFDFSYLKWYINDVFASTGKVYEFNMPGTDVTIVLNYDIYTMNENKIYFGSYPQTRVEDNNIISQLNTSAGELPSVGNNNSWTDYGYYIDSNVESYMWYIDIDQNNDGANDYRGVYFIKYRPFGTTQPVGISYGWQDDYKLNTNTVYWYKYEPIEWDILKEEDGKALIISNLIIDSQDYCHESSNTVFDHNGGEGYANNYALSSIRKWLNETFYNTAFRTLEKELINLTEVDNSKATTINSTSDEYVCENTNDNIFLLSYSEVGLYYPNPESRQCLSTDYAKCQGLKYYNNIDSSIWWTRSPYNKTNITDSSIYVSVVENNGSYTNNKARGTDTGVRPVLWITL